jgi:hypothetical protein
MPGMREIRSSMGVPQFQPASNGHQAPMDGLAEALAHRKSLLGVRLLDDTASQVAAQAQLDARRLEVDRSKLDLEEELNVARLQELRENRQAAQRQAQAPPGDVLGAVVQLMIEDRAAQREAAVAAMTAQQALWREMLELVRQPSQQPPPAAPLTALAGSVADLKTVFQLVEEVRPKPAPVAAGLSAHDQLQLKEMELRIEERRAELAQTRELQLRQLQLQEQRSSAQVEIERAKVGVEADRNAKLGNLLEQLAPPALAALSSRLNGDGGQQQQPQQPQAQPDPSYEQHQCISCHNDFLTRPGTTAVVCPHCNVYQELRPQQPG